MIRTVIGDIEIQKWISEFKINNPSVYGNNSFIDVTGVEICDKLGDKVTLKIALLDVPNPVREQLSEILAAESIPVIYTSRTSNARLFKKTEFTADCSDSDPEQTDYDNTENVLWDINITLESIDYAANSSGL